MLTVSKIYAMSLTSGALQYLDTNVGCECGIGRERAEILNYHPSWSLWVHALQTGAHTCRRSPLDASNLDARVDTLGCAENRVERKENCSKGDEIGEHDRSKPESIRHSTCALYISVGGKLSGMPRIIYGPCGRGRGRRDDSVGSKS